MSATLEAPERRPLADLIGPTGEPGTPGSSVEELTDRLVAATGAGDARALAALQDVVGADFVNQAFAKTNANDRELESRVAAITLAALGGVPLSSADVAGGYPKLDVNAKVAIARLYAGVAGGLATLDGQAKVPDAQLKLGVAGGLATLLSTTGKIPLTQIDDALIGGLNYQGVWNAATNTPLLGAGATKGHFYKVSVAGGTNLSGITDWQVGDNLFYNGAAWEKVDNTDQVTSVNNRIGAVTGLAEATDPRFTDARTPTAHRGSHAPGGTDPIIGLTDASMAAANLDGLAATPSLRSLGAGAQQAAPGNDARFHDHGVITRAAKLTADVSNSNPTANTLLNVPGLAFPVAANVPTRFKFTIEYTAAAVTTGARFCVTGPALVRLAARLTQPLSATTTRMEVQTTLSGGVPSSDSALVANVAILEGVILCSAAGTVTFQFSSEVASSAITVKAGSVVEYS